MIGRSGHYNVRTRFALTTRQREVLDLIARGKTNGEIGTLLSIETATVESHVHHILAKLGFTSRSQIAVWWALRAKDQ
jgi:non-specific serine/threonine protein kinase